LPPQGKLGFSPIYRGILARARARERFFSNLL
jgi:hypothetical protein